MRFIPLLLLLVLGGCSGASNAPSFAPTGTAPIDVQSGHLRMACPTNGATGIAILELGLDATGTVLFAKATSVSPPEVKDAAQTCLMRNTYRPWRDENGQPQSKKISVVMRLGSAEYLASDGPPESSGCPFPDFAMRANINAALVVLDVEIRENGRGGDARIVSASGDGFDAAALKCVKTLRFQPVRNSDGRPVRARRKVRVVFTR